MLHVELLLLKFPWLREISSSNLRTLYIVRILRDLLNRVTLFFLPIFLFIIGRDSDLFNYLQLTALQRGLLMVAIFYALVRVIIFFTAIPLATFSRRIGFEIAVVCSYVLRIMVFACLYYLAQFPWLVFLAAVLEAIQCNLFWNNFFTVLSERLHRKWAGSELGLMQFALQLITVLSPALSGFLAFFYGFEVLFLIGVLISIVSAVIIFSMQIIIPRDEVSWQEFFSWMKKPDFLKMTGSFVGRYINDAVLILWPLYVFLLLGSVDRVGFLYTFSLFLAMMITFFTGNYLNHIRSKKPFYFSGGALTAMWIVRSQGLSVWGVVFSDVTERLVGNFHWLFYDWVSMLSGKGRQAFSYFVYKEMIMSIGAVFFWIAFICFFMLSSSWNGVFLFAGIGVLLSLMISDNNEK